MEDQPRPLSQNFHKQNPDIAIKREQAARAFAHTQRRARLGLAAVAMSSTLALTGVIGWHQTQVDAATTTTTPNMTVAPGSSVTATQVSVATTPPAASQPVVTPSVNLAAVANRTGVTNGTDALVPLVTGLTWRAAQVPTSTPTPTTAPTATAQPTEQASTGDLVVTLTDDAGNPLGGACFTLTSATGGEVGTSCDATDDFPNNGRTGFFGIPAGDYVLSESGAIDGYASMENTSVTVTADLESDITITTVSIAPVQTTTNTTTAPQPPAKTGGS